MNQPENVAAHFFWIALPIILTYIVGQLVSNRATKKQREQEADKVATAIVERDKKLLFVLAEHPPHSHCEGPSEPLNADGIRYPKVQLNGEMKGEQK